MTLPLPNEFNYFQINEIKNDKNFLKLGIINPINPNECYQLLIHDLSHLSITGEEEDVYQIGEITITEAQINSKTFYQLHVDGDITIEATGSQFTLEKV